MNGGEKALLLMKDLSSIKNDLISPYNTQLVDGLLSEMDQLHRKNQTDIEKIRQTSPEGVSPNDERLHVVKVRHCMLLWDRRCLLSYHYARLMHIKKLRWEFGDTLPEEVSSNLSGDEIAWYEDYCTNLQLYMANLNDGKGCDIFLYKSAPKRNYIQVKCVVDQGDFELEDGTTVNLKKDSLHYLPLSQCEKLILKGVVEQVLN